MYSNDDDDDDDYTNNDGGKIDMVSIRWGGKLNLWWNPPNLLVHKLFYREKF